MSDSGGETNPDAAARRAVERAARESYGRLVAFLAARTRDVAGAEDALADAFTAALQQWPENGVPDNPDAWLLTVARRRSTDALRRRATGLAHARDVRLIAEELDAASALSDDIPDRRLALMFACAHPAIEPGIRTPLILQTILGLTAAEIASAFLVPPATMGQRLVRAKTRLKDAGIAFSVPESRELPERLDAVLAAIYAAYTKGWSDTGDAAASQLADEAIWLGRVIVALMPGEPEAKGMLALMLHTEARRAARRDADGAYVPLEEQDTRLWNLAMIDQAEALLSAASASGPSGRCQIEAAIQSAHAARRLAGAATWPAIVALYDILGEIAPSPVVALNRAVALGERDGPAAALAALDLAGADPRLADYQPYWAARAHLCARAGRSAEAAEAFTLAIGLTADPAVRRYLQRRQAQVAVAA